MPLIARFPGKIPAGHVSHQPAIIMDLFTTSLTAAKIPTPNDRKLDGLDIMPLLTSQATSPHKALFGIKGGQLCSVRVGKWKLHIVAAGPAEPKIWQPGEPYRDPRAPDGVRILAPYEQPHPSDFPGLQTGDPVTGIALFDLDQDAAEQHNLAAEHPNVVAELQALCNKMQEEISAAK